MSDFEIVDVEPNINHNCPGHPNVSNRSYLALAGISGTVIKTSEMRCRCCGDVKWTFHYIKEEQADDF